MTSEEVHYKRSRFSTRLFSDRLYTAGHCWLEERENGVWRIGFTKFATRMLGDIVEVGFETKSGDAVKTGQIVGWVEGFKAVTDIFSPISGNFEGCNPKLDEDITVLTQKPYLAGWLFEIHGTPGNDCLDVKGYVNILDTTIDKMLGQRHD